MKIWFKIYAILVPFTENLVFGYRTVPTLPNSAVVSHEGLLVIGLQEAAELKEKLEKVLADRNSASETNADIFAFPSPPKKIGSELM